MTDTIKSAQAAIAAMDASAPERIWLQVDTDGDNDDRSEPISRESWDELTWHYEPIGGQEVEYVRADLSIAAVREIKGEPVAWSRTRDICDDRGYPIGTDETEIRWQLDRPGDDWFPLYAHPMPSPAPKLPGAWQPIATAPRDTFVWFYVVPKTADETYCNTSGEPILSLSPPEVRRGIFNKSWNSLCKATHWHPDTTPSPPQDIDNAS